MKVESAIVVFYNLDIIFGLGPTAPWELEPVGKIYRAPPVVCQKCGEWLGALRRVPPFRYKTLTRNLGDLITDGSLMAVSERFKTAFKQTSLTGLTFSEEPITLTNFKAIYSAAFPAYTCTHIDLVASGADCKKPPTCDICHHAHYRKVDRMVIREETWNGEDVFLLSSLSGVIAASQRFFDFIEQHLFTGFAFVHQDQVHYDYSNIIK